MVGLAALYAIPMLIGGLICYKKEKEKSPELAFGDFINNSKGLKKINRILNRILGIGLACCLGGGFILLGTLKLFTAGPSQAWNASFAGQLSQSRRFEFLPHLFLSDEQLESTLAFTDEKEYPTPVFNKTNEDGTSTTDRLPERFTGTDQYGLEFVDGISYYETTYMNSKFYMITVADPTRVSVGLSAN